MSYLWRLDAGFTTPRPWLNPRTVGFVVDKIAVGQIYLRIFRYSSVNHYSMLRTLPQPQDMWQECRVSTLS
jgi:hypothetical protein